MRNLLLIAHRGNTQGPNPELENRPEYVDSALELGLDVEIDMWANSRGLHLGHDQPIYVVDASWVSARANKLWVHCKNVEAAQRALELDLNWFIHTSETHVITSKGFTWCYPGQPAIGKSSIQVVLPEISNPISNEGFFGICSDLIPYNFTH
jgi:hypothetical protein